MGSWPAPPKLVVPAKARTHTAAVGAAVGVPNDEPSPNTSWGMGPGFRQDDGGIQPTHPATANIH